MAAELAEEEEEEDAEHARTAELHILIEQLVCKVAGVVKAEVAKEKDRGRNDLAGRRTTLPNPS